MKPYFYCIIIFISSSCSEKKGCTDATACNYNSNAEKNDDSCTYPTESYLDCSGGCILDSDNDGKCDVNDSQPNCATNDKDACNNCGGDCEVTNSYTGFVNCYENTNNIVPANLCGVCGNNCYEQNCTEWPSETYDCNGYNLIDLSVIENLIQLNDNLSSIDLSPDNLWQLRYC